MMSVCPDRNFPVWKYLISLFGLLSITSAAMVLPVLAGPSLDVVVSGLEEKQTNNVINFLTIEKNKNDPDLTPRWIKKMHQKAATEIREALQPYGYYLPDIKSELAEQEGIWLAAYEIDAGDPLTINQQTIEWQGEGSSNTYLQQSIKDYYAQAPATLIHSRYEAAKSKFLDLALSHGYPKAKIIKSEVLVDLETNSADITIIMDTGPLYYFGDTLFKEDFLDRRLLEKYITLQKGEPYSHEALLHFQQNLLASGYAQSVTIKPLFKKATNKDMPLEVSMIPVKPHKFSFGLGYETDVGVRGSARWEDRLINRHGHQSDVNIKLSEKEGKVSGQYSIPVHKALTDRWVSSITYEYESTPDTESRTTQGETAFVRRNLEDTRFYKAFILDSYEYFTIGDDPEVTTNLLSVGGTYRISSMENSMYPRHGYSFFSDLRGAHSLFLSDTSFTRLDMKGRYLAGMGDSFRVDMRMEAGTAWVEDYDLYPTSLRYFAGGDNSIRGYKYQSLGPKDDEGNVEGGRQILTVGLEFNYRVAESWVVNVFTDGGNAYNEKPDKVYLGSGFGFRWLAPFGSLRVDMAWPVSEDPAIGDYRIHLGFGATL